jgi:hypothetical protein
MVVSEQGENKLEPSQYQCLKRLNGEAAVGYGYDWS